MQISRNKNLLWIKKQKKEKSTITRKMTDQDSRVAQQRIAHIVNIYSYIHR